MIPVLHTDRLTLRGPDLSDFEAFAEFRASDRASFVGGPNTRAEAWMMFCATAGQWSVRGYGRWIVADRQTDAPLGVVGLHHPDDWPQLELAWSMFAVGEGQGFALEAARAARAYGYKKLGVTELVSFVDPINARSAALAKRLDAEPDGVFQHERFGAMHIWRHPGPEVVQ